MVTELSEFLRLKVVVFVWFFTVPSGLQFSSKSSGVPIELVAHASSIVIPSSMSRIITKKPKMAQLLETILFKYSLGWVGAVHG